MKRSNAKKTAKDHNFTMQAKCGIAYHSCKSFGGFAMQSSVFAIRFLLHIKFVLVVN